MCVREKGFNLAKQKHISPKKSKRFLIKLNFSEMIDDGFIKAKFFENVSTKKKGFSLVNQKSIVKLGSIHSIEISLGSLYGRFIRLL